MSDDFIPLNQSTPVHGKWNEKNQSQRYQNNRYRSGHTGHRRGGHNNRWSNNSQWNSSHGSETNSSFLQDSRSSIDAYLHPSMLEDPWRRLRENMK